MGVRRQHHPSTALTRGKRPDTQLNRRLGGPQGRSGRFGEEKHLLPLPKFEPWIAQPAT
jgi:hypothetical protein